MNRKLLRLNKFAQFARDLGQLSTCKRDKVGVIIFPNDFTSVLAIGYNGPAKNLDNDSCTGVTPCNCAHAEVNALLKLVKSDSKIIMFTTRAPCRQCANYIINSRLITGVIFDEHYRNLDGYEVLTCSNILIMQYTDLVMQMRIKNAQIF